MANSRLTLSQLRAFEALLRTKSFSLAAKELNVSQPSLSNQIRALERLCGMPLINRIGHRIESTPLTLALLGKVRTVISLAHDIEQTILNGSALASGELRLGYTTYQYAIPILARFTRHYPGVRMDTISMASLDLIKALNEASIDVAMITAQDPPEGLFVEKLIDTQVVLMTPKDHPLARRKEIDWSELRDVPIIRREASSMTRVIFDTAARGAGMTLKNVMNLGSWGSMQAAVTAGMGCCIALLEEIEHQNSVGIVKIRDERLWARHYLACRPELAPAAGVQAFFHTALFPERTP